MSKRKRNANLLTLTLTLLYYYFLLFANQWRRGINRSVWIWSNAEWRFMTSSRRTLRGVETMYIARWNDIPSSAAGNSIGRAYRATTKRMGQTDRRTDGLRLCLMYIYSIHVGSGHKDERPSHTHTHTHTPMAPCTRTTQRGVKSSVVGANWLAGIVTYSSCNRTVRHTYSCNQAPAGETLTASDRHWTASR